MKTWSTYEVLMYLCENSISWDDGTEVLDIFLIDFFELKNKFSETEV